MTNEAVPIRVLIADDHAVVRGGLEFFMSSLDDVELVGQATQGEAAIRLCGELQPDVVLMDLEMPKMNGIEATKIIRQKYPNTQIVVLTSFNKSELIQDALSAGAIGFLLKNSSANNLKEAIVAAHQGRGSLSPEVSHTLVHQKSIDDKNQTNDNLTKRERQVLDGLALGLSNPQIAANLNISRNTVSFHIRNILTKLDASNRTEAVSIAMKRGLVRNV